MQGSSFGKQQQMNHEVNHNLSGEMAKNLSVVDSRPHHHHHHGGIPPSPQKQKLGSSHNYGSGSMSKPVPFDQISDHMHVLWSPIKVIDTDQSAAATDVSVELEKTGSTEGKSSQLTSPPIPSPARGNSNALRPPRHERHRRSYSDNMMPMAGLASLQQQHPQSVTMQLSGNSGDQGGSCRKKLESHEEDLYSMFMDLGTWNSTSHDQEVKDLVNNRANGTNTTKPNDDSSRWDLQNDDKFEISSTTNNSDDNNDGGSAIVNNSSEKRAGKRSAADGDINPTSGHRRSISMDSYMGSTLKEEESATTKLQDPDGDHDENSNKSSSDIIGNGEFTAEELKQIMENEKLVEMAKADPKRIKRLLANRRSAARSKERKLKYISAMEHKVHRLQTETTAISAQFTSLQRYCEELTYNNNELRLRLQAAEEEIELKDAIYGALTAEVQRLRKLTLAKPIGECSSSNNSWLPQTTAYVEQSYVPIAGTIAVPSSKYVSAAKTGEEEEIIQQQQQTYGEPTKQINH